ncbi:AsmA family protein [Paenochrobactrum pullorum]|uniref:AsmA family protein n=1 Tax=Paenochrobactrum pullorum TaxID=1324351 RepID=UPI0035BC7482
MPKTLRLILAIIVMTSAAAIAALTALPYIVSTDAIRIRVAQELSSWTGYTVELRQAPQLKFFPTLRASLNDVILSDYSDTATKKVMSVERIDVELSPFDALLGHISFYETQLVRPVFDMGEPVIDPQQVLEGLGKSDGRLGVAIRAAKELISEQKSDVATRQQTSQPFGRIVVRDGTLTFRKFGSDVDEVVNNINATLNWPQTTQAASLKGNLRWKDEVAEFDLSAPQPLQLFAGATSAINASITAKPLELSFNGKANISNDYMFEGALNVKSPDLSRTIYWLGAPPPPGSARVGALTVATTLSANHQHINLNDLVLDNENNPAKGAIEFIRLSPRPSISGTLAFQHLNFRGLISAFIPLPEKPSTNVFYDFERGIDDKRDVINTDFMQLAEVDLRLSAQTASAGPLSMNNVAAAVQVRNGRALFDIGDAKAFKGNVSASVQIQRDLQGTNAELRFNGSDIDSTDFTKVFGLSSGFISARGNIALIMKAPLTKWSKLPTNADGEISINFSNGKLQGFDIDSFIKNASSERFFALERKENMALNFKRLDVQAGLADGVATLNTAKLETESGTLSLAGIVPFLDRSLALSGTLTLPAKDTENTETAETEQAPEKPAPAIQFFVGGSWDRPFISPMNTP